MICGTEDYFLHFFALIGLLLAPLLSAIVLVIGGPTLRLVVSESSTCVALRLSEIAATISLVIVALAQLAEHVS